MKNLNIPQLVNSLWDAVQCSTAADLKIWAPDMSVRSKLQWYQLVFIHAYTLKNWLNRRYWISEDSTYRMWYRFIYRDWDLFNIVRNVKVNFYEYLNYWKTTFDDVVLPWVLLRPTSLMILYWPRAGVIFDLRYMYHILVL